MLYFYNQNERQKKGQLILTKKLMKNLTNTKITFMTGSREYESSINNENNLLNESIRSLHRQADNCYATI